MSNTNPANAVQVGQVPRTPFVTPDGRLTKEAVAFLTQLATQTMAPVGTVSTAGAGGATLPAAPAGFIEFTLNNTAIKLAFYNP